ncbi:Ig-like domain-containing protein [Eisenbergiella massiliensis]|uniref:Ig-like domain-containing protein n=1 Tax=Eisenbergiella massiliensis TaxID=1720294 RepID=UPI00399B7993
MAITKVRTQINGVWTSYTKNSNGNWLGKPTAPAITSFNRTEKYYPVLVEITNDAGTVVTYDVSDSEIGNSLKLQVYEKIKPTIALVTPTNGARVTNNKQPITFKVTDETNGSGIKTSTVSLKIDGNTFNESSSGMVKTAITNGYQFVYTPQTALSNGDHTITINAQDNDGNAATTVTASIKVDTVPPSLNITSPTNGWITNNKTFTLAGTTNDATSSPVTISAKLNGTDVGSITVTNGAFSKALTGVEGNNTLVVTAKDAAGLTTPVTINFKIDTSVPKIKSVRITPNPAEASSSIEIELEIE